MTKWKTIDSAPKDGTRVLLFDPNYEGKIACASFEPRYMESGWVERGHDYATDVWGCGEMNPTHWTELPEDPK